MTEAPRPGGQGATVGENPAQTQMGGNTTGSVYSQKRRVNSFRKSAGWGVREVGGTWDKSLPLSVPMSPSTE